LPEHSPAPVANSVATPAAGNARRAVIPPVDSGGVPLIMPHQDLTITEATVVRWIKQVGDAVDKDETVVEVETDKATTGIDAPAAGVLAQILIREGEVVALGQQLGTIKPK
jgi:pyruvate/2-oxoglutarate dehydrogenase complex dihydrolipoamide acyltransferase (E2) component